MIVEKYLKSCLRVTKMGSRIRSDSFYGLNLVYLTLNYFEISVILTFVQNYGTILNIKEMIKAKRFCFYSDEKYLFLYFYHLEKEPIVCLQNGETIFSIFIYFVK